MIKIGAYLKAYTVNNYNLFISLVDLLESAIILKPGTGKVNNIYYLLTVVPIKGVGYIRQKVNSQFLKLMHWGQEKRPCMRI